MTSHYSLSTIGPAFTLSINSVLVLLNTLWGRPSRQRLFFQDPMTKACAIDRLVHHAVILELSGTSYRAEAAKQRADKPAAKS
jgi:hypothetical protein